MTPDVISVRHQLPNGVRTLWRGVVLDSSGRILYECGQPFPSPAEAVRDAKKLIEEMKNAR